MKKKLIGMVATAMATWGCVLVANSSKASHLSYDELANIEALANGETSKKGKTCYNSITSKDGCQVRYCPTCLYVDGTDCWYSLATECGK